MDEATLAAPARGNTSLSDDQASPTTATIPLQAELTPAEAGLAIALEPVGGDLGPGRAAATSRTVALIVGGIACLGLLLTALALSGDLPVTVPVAVACFSVGWMAAAWRSTPRRPATWGRPVVVGSTRAPAPFEGLATEMERSRRYRRPLAVVRMSHARRFRHEQRWRSVNPLLPSDVDCLERMMRSTDRWWLDGSALHLLLPETGRAEAEQLVQRLRGAMQLPGDVRLAVFPVDGLTPGALRAALDAREERQGA